MSTRRAVTFRVDEVLLAEVRRFVRDHAGRPLYLTLSGFAESALAAHLAAHLATVKETVP